MGRWAGNFSMGDGRGDGRFFIKNTSISNFQFYFELSTLMKKQELFDEILCYVIFILKN